VDKRGRKGETLVSLIGRIVRGCKSEERLGGGLKGTERQEVSDRGGWGFGGRA